MTYAFYRPESGNRWRPRFIHHASTRGAERLWLSLDLPEDYDLIKTLHEDVSNRVPDYGAREIVAWIAAHADWFEKAAKILYLLGVLALALNLWRAISFSSLLLRGAQLLTLDVRDRRRDLENRVARLNQRVAALSTEAEAAAKRSIE